jgi:hypothetical protein
MLVCFFFKRIYRRTKKYVNMEGGGAREVMLAHGLILMRKYYAIFGRIRGNILPLKGSY